MGSRLNDVLSGGMSTPTDAHGPTSSVLHSDKVSELLTRFHHFTAPTLPHLLALLMHPCPTFPPRGTSVIVVDPVSAVFATAFPKVGSKIEYTHKLGAKSDQAHWVANRRWSVMGDFISKIGKLAAIHDIAILLTNQTTTKILPEMGAIVHPSISSTAWDSGVSDRIVLYRDWITRKDQGSTQGKYALNARFVTVVKAKGVSLNALDNVVPFTIEDVGCNPSRLLGPVTDSRSMGFKKLPLAPKPFSRLYRP